MVSIKTTTKSVKNKKPRPHTSADDRYNERRRAKRALAKLVDQSKIQRGSALEETRKHIDILRNAVKNSYKDKSTKQYKQTLEQFTFEIAPSKEYQKTISKQIKQTSLNENKRITKMQEHYFRQASRTEEQRSQNLPRTLEQKLSRAEQAFFYSKTRVLWLGGSEEMRNENILAGMENLRLESGRTVQNLQDAVQWVKEKYSDSFPTMEDVKKGVYDTDIDEIFLKESEEKVKSPDPISRSEFRSFGSLL